MEQVTQLKFYALFLICRNYGTRQNQENILEDIIRGPEDVGDVTSQFLNNSVEGDESLNRRDDSGEVEPDGWGEGEVGEEEADEGEAEGSGEVHIHILMKPKIVLIKPLLSIYIY